MMMKYAKPMSRLQRYFRSLSKQTV